MPPRKTAIKNTPQLLARYLFGDPCVHLPRTKKQSAGLFFAACGWPSCSIPRTEAPKKLPSLSWGAFFGDPCGNRTHVNGVRGRCLNRLTNGPYKRSRHLPIFTGRFQPTIFGTSELNFCVRNGNRWNLTVIDTGHIHGALSCFSFVEDVPSKLNIEPLS